MKQVKSEKKSISLTKNVFEKVLQSATKPIPVKKGSGGKESEKT